MLIYLKLGIPSNGKMKCQVIPAAESALNPQASGKLNPGCGKNSWLNAETCDSLIRV